MKVGHLTSDDFGGVSTMLYHLISCSRLHGRHDHHAIIADVNSVREQTLSNRLGFPGYVPVYPVHLSRIRWLLHNARDYDVLVAHKTAWYFWLGIYKLLFMFRERPYFIAVIHDGTLFLRSIRLRERITNSFIRYLCKKVIVVREDFVAQLRELLRRSHGVHYISNGLPSTSTPNKCQSIQLGQITVLSLSRLDDLGKDVGTVLQAIHTLNNSRYRMIVGGEGKFKSHWESMATRLQLDSQAKFVGEVTDVQGFLQSGTVFVLSSTFAEGTPLVLLEAMLAGVPIIASRTAVPKWAIDQRLCLCFEPGNVVDLVIMLGNFTALSVEDVNQMTTCARKYVQEHCDVIRQLESYEEVLEDCFHGQTDIWRQSKRSAEG